MLELSRVAFIAAIGAVSGALALHVVAAVPARAGRPSLPAGAFALQLRLPSGVRGAAARLATTCAINALVFLTVTLALRALEAGHGPFSNMYEFSLAFAWGVLGLYLLFEARYRLPAMALLMLPVVLGLLLYATSISGAVSPLVPALQNELLLTAHVMVAIVAYGAFAVSFGAGVLYLVRSHRGVAWLPPGAILDEMAYRAVMIGFPLLALVIILGAVWAETAWGSYWSWDPKETASLLTWLIYGGYLHARVMRGWSGNRSAWLLVAGFAATMFTYFGSLFFSGLHSYA